MRCLICKNYFNDDIALKLHYQYFQSINENNYFFREILSPDNTSERCDECKIELKNCRLKKNHNFFFHNQQKGGSRNQHFPLNVLKRDPITYFSISFQQHKDFCDFHDEKIVDQIFDSIFERFVARGDFKMKLYVELKNYQRTLMNWKIQGSGLSMYILIAILTSTSREK